MKHGCVWSIMLIGTFLHLGNRGVDAVALSAFPNDSAVKIGDDCWRHWRKCLEIDNAMCDRKNAKCKCMPGYVGLKGLSWCSQVTLGIECSLQNKPICEEIPHAECHPKSEVCVCKRGYFGTDGTTVCKEGTVQEL